MDWEQLAATSHVTAAVTGLVSGLWVLVRPKGTSGHRTAGTIYVVALLMVDIAALSVHREATFGVFHALAIVSLLTLATGIVPLLLGSRTPLAISFHAYCMTSSYAGLVAAGAGQLAVALADGSGGAVRLTIGAVLAISALLIFWRVPPVLSRMLPLVTP